MLQDTARQLEAVEIEETVKPPAPSFLKPFWWTESFDDRYTNRCRELVKTFLEGKLKRQYRMTASNGRWVFTSKNNHTELWMRKDNPSIKVSVCVARKANGMFFGNSSSMIYARSSKNKIFTVGSSGRLKIQEVVGDCMPMVPFQMFKEMQLNLEEMSLIEKGPDETVRAQRAEPVHFMGAMVFKIAVRQRSKLIQGVKDQYFLLDLDRNDLALRNLNFFLSKLSRPVTSIADAYESLKPDEVRNAERFLKAPVPRQGEWFFIPVQGEYKRTMFKNRWDKGPTPVQARLHAKGARPHFVSFLSAEGYVTGKVTQEGGSHIPINLDGWHKPVGNGAIESFKISGAID